MTDAGAAVGMDRLPWLDDEPAPRAPIGPREPKLRPIATARGSAQGLAGWVVASVLLVAGGSYWLGLQSGERAQSDRYETPTDRAPGATVDLPDARAPSVPIVETPEVRPAPMPSVTLPRSVSGRATARPDRRSVRPRTLKPMDMNQSNLSKTVAKQASAEPATKAKAAEAAPATTAPPAAKPLASRDQLKLWPSRVSSGASGRLVQIGAFGSRQQAKLGWRRMKRAYPAVGRLPAVVVEARNSRGKRFYRFQIGTTSQAHSEVLCQRMQSIRFSCAVVGLPWKSKVER